MSEYDLDTEVLLYRDKHGGVERRMLKETATRKRYAGFMDSQHAKLLDMMDEEQKDAMVDVYYGFLAFGAAGMGCKIGQYGERLSPATGDVSRNQDLALLYGDWSKECMREKLSPAMALDVIVYGKSMNQIASARRISKVKAKSNFLDCMDVYCKLRGWKR